MDTSVLPFVKVQVEWAMHHRWLPSQKSFVSRPMPHLILWLVLDGSVELRAPGGTWRAEPGMTFLWNSSTFAAPADEPHYVLAPQGAEWLSVGFQATLFGQINLLQCPQRPILRTPGSQERSLLEAWMRQLVRAWNNVEDAADYLTMDAPRLEIYWGQAPHERAQLNLASALVCRGLGDAVFGLCWQTLQAAGWTETVRQSIPHWLNLALEHVRQEPGTSVAAWARAVGFSPAQFRRLFQQYVSSSPQHYLAQYRMEAARRLLETTDIPIRAIAESLGFDSVPYFTEFFKRATGMPPARFRQAAQQVNV